MLLYMYLNITNREEQLLCEFLVSIPTGLFVDQFFDLWFLVLCRLSDTGFCWNSLSAKHH